MSKINTLIICCIFEIIYYTIVIIVCGAIFYYISVISDQSCFYENILLVYKNPFIFTIIIPFIFLSNIWKREIFSLFLKFEKTNFFEKTNKIIFLIFLIIIAFWSSHLFWFYGNPGAGACSEPNVNKMYFYHKGQKKFL